MPIELSHDLWLTNTAKHTSVDAFTHGYDPGISSALALGRVSNGNPSQNRTAIQQNEVDPGTPIEASQRKGHVATSGLSTTEIELRKRIHLSSRTWKQPNTNSDCFRRKTFSALRMLAQRQKLGSAITAADKQTQTALLEEHGDDDDEAEDEQEKEKEKRRPPRITRTRTGCTNCRQRRKKCVEERPTCGACHRLGMACSYSPTTNFPNRQSEDQVPASMLG